MTADYYQKLPEGLKAYMDETVRLRRELHKIPETGFNETRTQAFIQDYLKKLGYEPETIVDTGVALFIPGNDGGKLPPRAIRGDMDGLGVTEASEADWASEHPGMMHACGHDGHMTMLLITIRYIAEHPNTSTVPFCSSFSLRRKDRAAPVLSRKAVFSSAAGYNPYTRTICFRSLTKGPSVRRRGR